MGAEDRSNFFAGGEKLVFITRAIEGSPQVEEHKVV